MVFVFSVVPCVLVIKSLYFPPQLNDSTQSVREKLEAPCCRSPGLSSVYGVQCLSTLQVLPVGFLELTIYIHNPGSL